MAGGCAPLNGEAGRRLSTNKVMYVCVCVEGCLSQSVELDLYKLNVHM